ncbi:hypothetical protein AB6A40_005571 [Gnathostoma spinigerum]|uniref:propionyl-CoA carboxylase n=1 Tax=Gnathostoma spinigerum TaxID=75299 RepID=A0ABD6EQM9_9BILA
MCAAFKARKTARAQQFTNQHSQRGTVYNPYSKEYDFVVEFPKIGDNPPRRANAKLIFEKSDPREAVVLVDGKKIKIEGEMNLAQRVIHVTANGRPVTTQIAEKEPASFTLIYKGSPFRMKIMPSRASSLLQYMKEKPKLDLSTVVISPMPGAIKSVTAKEGQMVSEGQELCVMEAMKMQNSLLAGKTGKVKKVNVKPGDTVDEGVVLIELE